MGELQLLAIADAAERAELLVQSDMGIERALRQVGLVEEDEEAAAVGP